MTWTYDPLLATARDRVRSQLGDVDTPDQQLSDEAIAYYLTAAGNVEHLAAALLADDLAAKYARLVNTSNLSLSISASDRFAHYQALAKALRSRGNNLGAVLGGMLVGGSSEAEVEALEQESDAVQPKFGIGMDRNPRIGDDDLNTGDD